MMALGYNSIWLGVVLVVCIEIGQLTPPVGVNLFVVHGITGRKYFKDVVLGSVPFFLLEILLIILLTIYPSVATWLPSLMVKKF